ncbi:MAG: hypothetical protein FJ010_02185 [Chloroflexi bacterium]|nr:hypothetical protein [Chloroflexota bacterium]
MEAAFKGLLSRPQAFSVRQFSFDIFVYPYRDPGCRLEGANFLGHFSRQYQYGLIVYDREGSGSFESRELLEESGESRLQQVGWRGRGKVIVIDPELEVWVWTRSPHLANALGWADGESALRNWLVQKGFAQDENAKPQRPKEAMEAALRQVRKPRSSSIYQQIAERVSLQGHTEPAFLKLRAILSSWFGT